MKTQNLHTGTSLQPSNFGLFMHENRRVFMSGTASAETQHNVQNTFEKNVEGEKSNPNGKLDKIKIAGKDVTKENIQAPDLAQLSNQIQDSARKTLEDVYKKVGLDINTKKEQERVKNFLQGVDFRANGAIEGTSSEWDKASKYFNEFLNVFEKFEGAWTGDKNKLNKGMGLLEQVGREANVTLEKIPTQIKEKFAGKIEFGNNVPDDIPEADKQAIRENMVDGKVMFVKISNEGARPTIITCGRGFKDVKYVPEHTEKNVSGNDIKVSGVSILDGDGDMITLKAQPDGTVTVVKAQLIDERDYLDQSKDSALKASEGMARTKTDATDAIKFAGGLFGSALAAGALNLGKTSGKSPDKAAEKPKDKAAEKPAEKPVELPNALKKIFEKPIGINDKDNIRQEKIKMLTEAIKQIRPKEGKAQQKAFDNAVKIEMPKFLGITTEPGKAKMLNAEMKVLDSGYIEFTFIDKPKDNPQQPSKLTLKTNGDIELTIEDKTEQNAVMSVINGAIDAGKQGLSWLGSFFGDKSAETPAAATGKEADFKAIQTKLKECGICFADVPVAMTIPVALPAAPDAPAAPTATPEKSPAAPKKKLDKKAKKTPEKATATRASDTIKIQVEPKAGNKPAAPAKPAEELKTNLESVLNAETSQKAATALLKLKDSDVNGKEKDVLGKLLGIDSTKITTKIRSITIENGIITVVPKAAQTIKFSNETISFKDKSSPIKIEIPYKEMAQRPILQAYIKGLQN